MRYIIGAYSQLPLGSSDKGIIKSLMEEDDGQEDNKNNSVEINQNAGSNNFNLGNLDGESDEENQGNKNPENQTGQENNQGETHHCISP